MPQLRIDSIKMRETDKREKAIPKTVPSVKGTEKLATEGSMKKDKYETLEKFYNFILFFPPKVSYKKIETNQLMGSIQLGIHDSVGGLAKYPERLEEICILTSCDQLSKLYSRQNFALNNVKRLASQLNIFYF